MSMVFALVLLGCADDGSACERLAAAPAYFTSQALCEAGHEIALQGDAAQLADYPTVVSRCVRLGAAPVAARVRGKTAATLR